MITFVFYYGIVLLLPTFFFSWKSRFSGSLFMNGSGILLLSSFFIVFPMVLYGIGSSKFSKLLLRKFPTLYNDGIQQKRYMKWGLLTLLEGITHSIIIFVFLYYFLGQAVSMEGNTLGLETLKLSSFFCIFIILFVKVFSPNNRFLFLVFIRCL